jgi:glutamate synthase (NADPH/NADH) large chain
VILGSVGDNFAAGMTGGMAFVYDEAGTFEDYVNEESVVFQRIQVPYYEDMVRDLVTEHVQETQSRFAEQLLNDWHLVRHRFWQITPKEMLHRLEIPVTAAAAAE